MAPNPRRFARKTPQPIRPAVRPLPEPPPERPRMAWRREDGRGDLPPDLWALMQEGGRRLAAMPTPHRADQLNELTLHAAFKTWVPGTPAPWAGETDFQPAPAPAGGVSDGDWWETPAAPEKPSGAALEAFALEAFAALQAADPDPTGSAEAPEPQEADWWTT